jgi:tetratricopeptide (TPR) repeat protein
LRATPCIFLRMFVLFPFLALLFTADPALPRKPQKSFENIGTQADTARTSDHLDDAITLYSEGVRLRPSWSAGWWWLGSLLYEQDRFSESQAALQHFVAIARDPAPAYAFLGLCEYEMQDYDQAQHHFQLWARKGWPGTADLIDVAAFHWALLLTRKGRFLEALFLLATEAGKLHNSPALAEAMGLASLRMANLPEDYPPERREMVWLAGEAALNASLPSKEFDRADDYLRRLTLHYGQKPNVHYFRGTIFTFERKNEEAKAEFQAELQISPGNVPALLELARMDMDSNELSEAASLAKRATEIAPNDADAHHMMGRVLLATDQFQESARELEIAEQLAPDSATIRSHLALAYRRLGRTEEAKRETAAFLSLKEKEEVMAPPQEKTAVPKQAGPPK